MRETSLEAFKTVDLQRREKEVLGIIQKLQPCYNEQIADYLKRPINTITGRVNGLYNKGVITDFDKIKNTRGRSVIRWVMANRQMGLF